MRWSCYLCRNIPSFLVLAVLLGTPEEVERASKHAASTQLGKQSTAVVEHVVLRNGDTLLALEQAQWRFKMEMVELWEQDQRRVGVLGVTG